MDAGQLQSLRPALYRWLERFRPCFKRAVTFGHFLCDLLGLMAELQRKSIEPIALAGGVAVRTDDLTTYSVHKFYIDAPLDSFDKNVVFAVFAYADDMHEIDIEPSRFRHQAP